MGEGGVNFRYLLRIITIFFLSGMFSFARAEEAKTVSLESLVAEARANNPELKAAEWEWKASGYLTAGTRIWPDPMFMVKLTNDGSGFSLGKQPMSVLEFSLSQEIPFPGKLSLNRAVAEQETLARELQYRAVELDVLSRLKSAFYDWWYFARAIESAEKVKETMTGFRQAAESRYSVGKGAQADVLRAQVEVAKLETWLLQQKQKRDNAGTELNRLLNRPPEAELGIPGEVKKTDFKLTFEELQELARKGNPELQAREKMIEQSRLMRRVARWGYVPDFQVSGAYGYRKGLAMGDMWSAGVSLNLPLYFWKRQGNEVKQAEAGLYRSEQEKQATLQEVLGELKKEYQIVSTAETLVNLYQNGILSQCRLSLESTLAGYTVGQVDFLALLDSVTVLFNHQLEYYEQLAEYQKALARIERLIGKEISK